MMPLRRTLTAIRRRFSDAQFLRGIFQDGIPLPPLSIHTFIDLILISFAVIAFCSIFLAVGVEKRLPGLEADVFQALDQVLLKSLSQGSFPLWNPYIDTGLPFIADPMLHSYNPVVSLPVLLFGVWDGFKIGLALSFLLAAWGMYALAASLGTRRITRIWLSLMFCFAGQPVARFFQGQYLLVLGFAWIPWIFFGFSQALQTRARWAAALTVVSAAFLFFSGNAYYSFLALVSLVIFSFTWILDIRTTRPYISWDRDRARMAALIAGVSLLVISVQLLPTLDFLPYVNKASDVQGFHTPFQIFLDLTSKDSARADAFSMLPAREEYYAYIGFTPFIGLLMSPLAWRSHKKWVVFSALLLLFTLGWIGIDRAPWGEWILNQPIVLMFRHLLRSLLFSSFAVLLLGALGFDKLLQHISHWIESTETSWVNWQGLWRRIPLMLIWCLMLYGVADLYITNRPILKPWDRPRKLYEAMAWIRKFDPDDLYVRYNPNNHGHDAIIANDLRFLTPWYHYTEIRNMRGETRDFFRPLLIQPHYLVTLYTRWLPRDLDWTLIHILDGTKILEIDDSLPMAFTIEEAALRGDAKQVAITKASVLEQGLFWDGTNQTESIVKATGDELLVQLVSFHPDWQVRVDGERGKVLNVDGVLGVRALAGLHKYNFSFRPTWFYIGLILSLIGVLTLAYWLRDGIFGILSSVRRSINNLPQKIQEFSKRMADAPRGTTHTDLQDVHTAWRSWRAASSTLLRTLVRSVSWQSVLFVLGLMVYLASRLIGLEQFPIYFFSDEAVQTVLAADFVRDGLHGYDGVFFPTYFENASLYNLSVSVYLQIIPYLLFGKSVFVTRAVPGLVSASAVLALGLILKRTYRLSYWWTAPFALGLIPTWFLHSRTAFETTLFVSFTTWAFYFYLEYRQGKPWNLLPAMLFGALGFYSYAGAQIVLGVFGLLVVAIDWRYHRQHRRVLVFAGLFAILLVYPYFRFRSVHAAETYFHFRRLDSYWYQELSPWTKVLTFLEQYLKGLSPIYWFSRYPDDLARHQMRGYGRISLLASPFLLIGLYAVIKRFRAPEHRTLLLLMLAAPLGGALISVGITRLLLMVIPAAIFIGIGFSRAISAIQQRSLQASVVILSFILFVGAQFFMLNDSLRNGPIWYSDYGMAGMQYGAQQVFNAADELASQPNIRRVYVSPTWANGTDILMRFFLPDDGPVGIANAGPFLEVMQPDTLMETAFVLTPSEYQDLLEDPKVGDVMVEDILNYPNGEPGFYFIRFTYSPEAAASFAQEQALHESIQTARSSYRGIPVLVEYPYTDMGELKDIFDDDPYTLLRFYAANPATIRLSFDEPITVHGISVTTGSMNLSLTCRLFASDSSLQREFSKRFTGLPDDPTVELDFGEPFQDILGLEIEITAISVGTPFKIHVRDITLK